MDDQITPDEWLEAHKEWFRQIKSYNSTVITVGYATFFAVLFYLKDKISNDLTKWGLLSIVLSASIFALYELINNISLSLGKKSIHDCWACFFIPSVILAATAVILIVINLLIYF